MNVRRYILFFYEHEPVSLFLDNLSTIENFKSKKQSIKLLYHDWLGKILIINNEIQHIENYQPFYHEFLVHLPISIIPNIKTAFIIGGGSLFAAFEILKYSSVEKLILCDHDHEVLDLMKQYYKHAELVFADPRFHFIEQDANIFLSEHTNKYDLVVNDCFNLSHQSNLYNNSYYSILSNLNTDDGVCSDIIYRHIFDKQTTIDTLELLEKEKPYKTSLIAVPEYPGILHLQTIWGKSPTLGKNINVPRNKIQQDFLNGLENAIAYQVYSPKFLPFYFHIPPYLKELFDKI